MRSTYRAPSIREAAKSLITIIFETIILNENTPNGRLDKLQSSSAEYGGFGHEGGSVSRHTNLQLIPVPWSENGNWMLLGCQKWRYREFERESWKMPRICKEAHSDEFRSTNSTAMLEITFSTNSRENYGRNASGERAKKSSSNYALQRTSQEAWE